MSIKKIIVFLILSIFSIPISMVFSNIVHLGLSGISIDISNIEFNYLIENLLNNENQFMIFLYIEILFILFFITVLFIQGENVYETGLMKITDNISTPIPSGRGQHGTARWLTKKEYRIASQVNVMRYFHYPDNERLRIGQFVFLPYNLGYRFGFRRK